MQPPASRVGWRAPERDFATSEGRGEEEWLAQPSAEADPSGESRSSDATPATSGRSRELFVGDNLKWVGATLAVTILPRCQAIK